MWRFPETREKKRSITFHHQVTAGRGPADAVLCFAHVFAAIKLGRLGQFQHGDAVQEVHQTGWRLTQLPVTFEPGDGDFRGSRDAARQCDGVTDHDLLRLWLFGEVRSL